MVGFNVNNGALCGSIGEDRSALVVERGIDADAVVLRTPPFIGVGENLLDEKDEILASIGYLPVVFFKPLDDVLTGRTFRRTSKALAKADDSSDATSTIRLTELGATGPFAKSIFTLSVPLFS